MYDFYQRDARFVAEKLLGRVLQVLEPHGTVLRGRIVETEAYLPHDPGAHSFRGRTNRNASMFLSGGHLYLYRIYGIHQCFNVVTGPPGIGAAVLIRALEPMKGIQKMWRNRYGASMPQKPETRHLHGLSNGPAKLVASFGLSVDRHDGMFLGNGPISILNEQSSAMRPVATSRRIGLGKGAEFEWRWFLSDSPYLSRKTDAVPRPK